MHYVKEADSRGDVCALCGMQIKAGTVFVAKHVRFDNGQDAWIPCHLHCNARLRGAKQEKLRALPIIRQ